MIRRPRPPAAGAARAAPPRLASRSGGRARFATSALQRSSFNSLNRFFSLVEGSMTKLGLVALVVAIGCGSSLQRPADGAAGTGGGDDGGNDGAADAPPAATLMACAPNVPPCGAGRTCILGW